MSRTKICEQLSEFLYDVLQEYNITAVEQAYLSNEFMPEKPFITMQITSSEIENYTDSSIDENNIMTIKIAEIVKVRLRSYADNILIASELLNTARNYLYTDKSREFFSGNFIFKKELSSVNAIAARVNESYEYSATLDLEFALDTFITRKVDTIENFTLNINEDTNINIER